MTRGRPQSEPSRTADRLLAQIFQRNLNTFVEQLLHVGAKLIAAACAAMEELHHLADRGVRLALDLGGAAEVGLPVEVEIDCISEIASALMRSISARAPVAAMWS